MRPLIHFVFVSFLFSFMFGCSSTPAPEESNYRIVVPTMPMLDVAAVEAAQIKNVKNPSVNMLSAGQPTQEQFETLADAGVQHVVSLRLDEELDWDEKAHVESLGMNYVSLPINGDVDVTKENARALRDILDSFDQETTLIHCGSGNRVGALMAIDAALETGADIESSVLVGKEWGLNRLEPTVRAQLSE